ncbi:MAG: hypothetical protein JNM25_17575 [Planctomycetes bacterium]|nr:hypothetical protein [Planctomycetota bacterium]
MCHATATVLLLLLFGACATSYTPSPDRPFEAITTEFRSTNTVALMNAQPADEEVRSGRWYVNYHAWTDVAVTIARRELVARGMTVAEGGARQLRLSIESATTETGWVKITSQIVMRVETGDGYAATYTGVNSSSMVANFERQIDGAMMRVVVAMLSDPHIVAYLTK